MTTRSRKSLLLGTALVAAGLVLGAGGAAAQKKGGTLIYANVSGAGTMDPHVAANVVEVEMIHQTYEALVEMGETYNATPMLASKVDISPDAQRFTFTLRHGVKFQNGKEMTAADVLATMQRYKRVSPNAAQFSDVASMDTPDPYTFIITLNHPYALLVEAMKTPTYPFSIIPAEQKDKPARELDIVGTGPYQMAEWLKDDHLTFRRFEGYTQDEAAKGPDGYAGRKTAWLDTVRYNFVPEANARIAALQAGDADFISLVPPDQVKRIQGQAGLTVMTVSPFCQQEFVLHSQNAPTDNPLIRQAISAVVNVDEIVAASGQIAQRNPSLMFPTSPYHPGDAAAQNYDTKSTDKAKALLKQAGYSGQKIVLETNSNYTYMHDGILVLAEEMKAAGMNAEVKMTDWTTNANDMGKGTGGWNVSTTGFCSGPLLGPQQWRPLLIGFPQIKNDTILDDAYKSLFQSPDIAKRKADWLTIEKRILGQAYMIKVADLADVRAYNSNKFANLTPYYTERFWDVWAK
ncbi:MAG: ABC transporter substrate-binding protein [Nevskiales bacterium]